MNWYKKSKIVKEAKIVELTEDTTPADKTEAIKLKDGRILYDYDLEKGHWGLLKDLKSAFIIIPDFESVGYVDTDGLYNPIAEGEDEIYEFFSPSE